MKYIIEESVSSKVLGVLSLVSRNWNVNATHLKMVSDITTEPYREGGDGNEWKLIFPVEGGAVFFIDYSRHQDAIRNYAGGAIGDGNKVLDSGDRAAIVVYGDETDEVMELRLVHELLHAMDLNSDDLLKYTWQFLPFWSWLWFRWQQYKGLSPEHNPTWQRKYYRWLLRQRQKEIM